MEIASPAIVPVGVANSSQNPLALIVKTAVHVRKTVFATISVSALGARTYPVLQVIVPMPGVIRIMAVRSRMLRAAQGVVQMGMVVPRATTATTVIASVALKRIATTTIPVPMMDACSVIVGTGTTATIAMMVIFVPPETPAATAVVSVAS